MRALRVGIVAAAVAVAASGCISNPTNHHAEVVTFKHAGLDATNCITDTRTQATAFSYLYRGTCDTGGRRQAFETLVGDDASTSAVDLDQRHEASVTISGAGERTGLILTCQVTAPATTGKAVRCTDWHQRGR